MRTLNLTLALVASATVFAAQSAQAAEICSPGDAVSSLVVYNCHKDHESVAYWLLDHQVGSWKKITVAPYSGPESFGTCPRQGASPTNIPLTAGHTYSFWAMDVTHDHPGQCSENDPQDPPYTNCLITYVDVLGASTAGKACQVLVTN